MLHFFFLFKEQCQHPLGYIYIYLEALLSHMVIIGLIFFDELSDCSQWLHNIIFQPALYEGLVSPHLVVVWRFNGFDL